ncbi:hypothetical protein K493DRAFT_300050 [Basidiobolus meristosporus CBS 931.73]|uniref:SH3 domain-containing protein n=1 Tax=Basidiobolus meristosporus CBS 931.73 TaxID=1314790 RepID=A0A1Y1YJK6_9FUNG|nr:hypothetical protein K493DRAFT_300050 [Basidiobolus meristosporus CBS 931.73]|eukprot:ORX98200.1 hypothetical protein K493DRAFT_300050 [Basidiobolus meristosporus CBS 931.73]
MDTIQGPREISKFQSHFQCPGYTGVGQRYKQSIICAAMIASETNRASCIRGSSVPPLCKKTCLNYYESVRKILMDTYVCLKAGVDRESLLLPLLKRCNHYPFNGVEGHCIDGDANEPHSCGYTTKNEICKNCSANSTLCVGATKVSNPAPRDPFLFNTTYTPTSTIASTTTPKNSTTMTPLVSTTTVNSLKSSPTKRVDSTGQNAPTSIPHNKAERSVNMNHAQTYTQVNRILLTGVAITCSLLGITVLALCIFCCCSPCPAFSRKQRRGDCLTGKRIVIHPFFARREDEIFLNRNDWVDVRVVFDDNWAIGKNLTTGNAGAFPLVCTALSKSRTPHGVTDGAIPPRTTSARLSDKRNDHRQGQSSEKQLSLLSEEADDHGKRSGMEPVQSITSNTKVATTASQHRDIPNEEISETFVVFPETTAENLAQYRKTAKAIMITPQQAVYTEERSSL